MAGPLPCDNHPAKLAAILMTNLETGDTLTLCGPCLMDWANMLVGGQGPEPEPETPALAATEELADVDTEVFDETLARLRQDFQEAADLEPEPPAPDAKPKSEPQLATPPAEEAEPWAEATQESTTPGE